MFKFFLKKNFVDIWDNIFHAILLNFVTVVVMLAALFLVPLGFSLIPVSPEGFAAGLINVASILTSSVIISTVIFTESTNAYNASNYSGTKFRLFFTEIPVVFPHAAVCGIFFGLLYLVASISLPYYLALFQENMNITFLALAALLFWFLVVTVLALQYLLPVYAIMKNGFFKSLKKCYIIFFDNTLFSIGIGIVNLINLALTVLTFGMAPDIIGISVTCTNALRLRLYKYDWLEVNPGLSRKEQKDVPWKDLLRKENEMLGPHPIKSALFPWKYR